MINRLFLESSGVHEIDLLLDSGGKLFPLKLNRDEQLTIIFSMVLNIFNRFLERNLKMVI